MAGPADQLFGLAQQSIQNREGDVNEAVQLGQQIQQVQANRHKIEQAKDTLQHKKLGTLMTTLENIRTKVPKAAQRSMMKNLAKPQAESLKMPFDDTFVEAYLSPDISPAALSEAITNYNTGLGESIKTGQPISEETRAAGAQFLQGLGGDATVFANVTTKTIGQQTQAEAVKAAARAQDVRQQVGIQAAEQKQDKTIQSTGVISADREFGKETSRFRAAGGQKTIEKNIDLLDDAISDLKKPGKLSGSIRHLIPLLNDDSVTDVVDPKLAAVRDKIKGAIQATLKETLGAQFAEKEGEAIYNRAFNPRLDDEENIRRATVEVKALKSMAKSKLDRIKHFERTGSTQGFVDTAPKRSGGGISADLVGKVKARAQGVLQQGKDPAAVEANLRKSFPGATDSQIKEIMGQ